MSSRVVRAALRRPFALAALFALVAACASQRQQAVSSYEARVALVDLRDGLRWELRSESHTPLVDLYSRPRPRADIKVTTDEVMAAAVADLEQNGFAAHARSGAAPADGSSGWTRALEIEVGGRSRHVVTGPGATPETQAAFRDLTKRFLELFNVVQGFQHIDNRAGSDVFESRGARVQGR